jgi:Histidine phosphatase superfamily (branch 1)
MEDFTMIRTKRLIAWLVILMFVAGMAGCIGARVHSKPGTTTTVILIRHADRDEEYHLTAKGRARAEALADAVGDMGITAIFSPDLERNIDTVKPLADHLGIEITLKPKTSMPKAHAIASEMVTDHAGSTVLWVGNISGNLQAIYYRLGGKGRGPLEYGDLYILTVADKGPTEVAKSKYGD